MAATMQEGCAEMQPPAAVLHSDRAPHPSTRSVEALTPAADRASTRAPPAPDPITAATAELTPLTVPHLDKDYEITAEIAFDVTLMTSHVAQLFIDDAEWAATLRDLHRALVPGGRLVFDSRDPRGRGWQHYLFPHRQELLSSITLRFRTQDELHRALTAVGFHLDAVCGGWRQEPVGHPDGESVVVPMLAGSWVREPTTWWSMTGVGGCVTRTGGRSASMCTWPRDRCTRHA
jgi:hypothetical protein